MIRRPPRSTLSSSSAASDVYKRQVINPPAIDNAVHTTPPIINAATIPELPVNPTETSITEDNISVINVIPLTGFVPTIAIAVAATVVKRNEIIITIANPTIAYNQLSTTPN